MKQYLDALRHVLENGADRQSRTGIKTRAVFGMQLRFNMEDGFPAVTTKKLPWKSVASELLWFIEGSDDERRLAEILHGTRDESKKTIWTAFWLRLFSSLRKKSFRSIQFLLLWLSAMSSCPFLAGSN